MKFDIMKINEKWHQANKMPKNGTLKERMEWHIEHIKNCGCRPIPEKLQAIIKSRK